MKTKALFIKENLTNFVTNFISRKDYNTMVNLATALKKNRINVFHFDFAESGGNEGSLQHDNYS